MLSQHSSAMSRNEEEKQQQQMLFYMRLGLHKQLVRASIATIRSLMGRSADGCARPGLTRAKGRKSGPAHP